MFDRISRKILKNMFFALMHYYGIIWFTLQFNQVMLFILRVGCIFNKLFVCLRARMIFCMSRIFD